MTGMEPSLDHVIFLLLPVDILKVSAGILHIFRYVNFRMNIPRTQVFTKEHIVTGNVTAVRFHKIHSRTLAASWFRIPSC